MFESNYLATILDMKMEVTALDIKLGVLSENRPAL